MGALHSSHFKNVTVHYVSSVHEKKNTFLIISFTLRYMSDKNLINHGIFYPKKKSFIKNYNSRIDKNR